MINVRSAAGLVVLMACLLSACTRDTGESAVEEPALHAPVMAADPASVDPKLIDFPLDAYAKNANLELVPLAKDILVQECLQRLGLDVPLPERGPGNQWPVPTWDWYGLWDEETAQIHGYQSPPLISHKSIDKSVPVEWWPVLLGEVAAFNGAAVPEGGCHGEADRRLGIEDDIKLIGVNGLQQQAVTRARQHSAVEALIDDWAECLARDGWEFNDPSDPFRQWQDLGLGPAGSTAEIELALGDIACKKETGLLRVWVAAEFAYQEILVEENAQALAELSDWRDDLRRKVNEVVAGS